ncbi:site-specific integrase, partial [Segatella copri]
SAMVFVRNLRAMVFRAIDNEWLVKDPFRRYEYKEEETTREFLTKEEIRLLMEIPITRKKMNMVRDLFLFCCFTGLAFIDLYNLKEENIKTFFDDGEWIIIHRQKTGTEADIKLLDYPKQIMEKYRGLCEDGRVFPVPNYKSCMDSLKRLGKKCGITKPLSWHMSRHSFATSVCLSNGVPIETVSSMLGHKDIKTTQVYAKITKEKLSKDVEKLSQQINNIEEFTFGNVCNDNTNTINGRV